jgi:hypothetical protein
MADETYNGWTNRETWAANLHITNDQGLLEMATERLEEFRPDLDEDGNTSTDGISFRAGEALRDWYEEIVDEFGDSEGIRMMVKEVGSAWRVDWQEVAEGLLED